MIQLKSEIQDDWVDILEGIFYEMPDCPWSIVQIKENDAYKLLGCFDDEEAAKNGWELLRQEISVLPEIYELAPISEDWKDEYKKYLKPWICEHLHWVPEWMKDDYAINDGDVAFYFDAGMAFGTGMHETTQLCAERLLEFKKYAGDAFVNKKIIDAGCGSGILGISAQLLGVEQVVGFDVDPEAVRVAEENAKNNHASITLKTGGIEESLEPGDLILANILANILMDNAKPLLSAVNPNGWLVLSGILAEEAEKVHEKFAEQAKQLGKTFTAESHQKGEWIDWLFKNVL